MFNFKEALLTAFSTYNDIYEHLAYMNLLAKTCHHVTEFGVRWGTSSLVWMNNPVTLRAYDIVAYPESTALFAHAAEAMKDAKLIIADTTALTTIEYTDLLFLDSLHTYNQVKQELRFAPYVRKYLLFHDTVSFGHVGEDGGVGILPAISEFLIENPDWIVMDHRMNCNGLMTLARKIAI